MMHKFDTTHTFESNEKGLRVLTDYMPDTEAVSISVLVKAGSRHEEENINGISHFLEHMAFKGTTNRTARQIAEEFDMIGGYFNAYTNREHTCYHAKVLKDDWQKAMDIIPDILQNSIFDSKELDNERNVILQEIAQSNDDPEIVFDHFQNAVFPDQSLGRTILGPAEFIKTVGREQFIEYMNKHYVCNNVIVSAAGNFEHSDLAYHAFNAFNSLPSAPSSSYQSGKYVGGDVRVQKDLEQVHLIIGFNGISVFDPHYYDMLVLSIIAGGGMSSKLFQEIREKRSLAYHISTFTSFFEDCGIFGVYSATNENDVNELISATAGELDTMTRKITHDEIKRAKAQVKASLLMARESSNARADKMASNYSLFGRLISISEILSKIEAVDNKSLQLMMERLLKQSDKPTFAAIGKIDKIYGYDTICGKFR